MNEVEMPRYTCHKKVLALKIKSIQYHADLSATITPDDEGYDSFIVDNDYLQKHSPQPGGYYVVYNDGYKSYSPAKAFEDGYTRDKE